MKTCFVSSFARAALVAAAAFVAVDASAVTGELLSRSEFNDDDPYHVTDPEILVGLPPGSLALSVVKGGYVPFHIPNELLDAPGHPYTLVLKFKTQIENDWLPLVNMPASNDSDAMIYLDKTTRKVCIKQFNKGSGQAKMSSKGVELNRWTVLAFAFDTNKTEVFLDGELIYSETGALAGSYADCSRAGGKILIGADDDGEDNLFYLADFRLYDGAVRVADELPGLGEKETPFRISSAADWALFATNINTGMAACLVPNYYELAADIGSADAPITQTVGTDDHPFVGVFDGNSNTIHVAINGSIPGTALFARTRDSIIHDLSVSGAVTSTVDYAAGLIGLCLGSSTNGILRCNVSADISVSGAGHAGGIIGHGGTNDLVALSCAYSGTISGFSAHAGGIIGWYESDEMLAIGDCLFAGSFDGSGKYHPMVCQSEDAMFSVNLLDRLNYCLNTVVQTETSPNLAVLVEYFPVNKTLIPGSWDRKVIGADGNAYYLPPRSVLTTMTSSSLVVALRDGDVLSGTGGPDTCVVIVDGATVTLDGATITGITDDKYHNWAGITCLGNATIILKEGTVSRVKNGYANFPAIQPGPPGTTLTIRGPGALEAKSNGGGAGIGSRVSGSCGNIRIEGGNVVASSGSFPDTGTSNFDLDEVLAISRAHQCGAGIGSGMGGSCGDITITGGDVNAQSLDVGIGSGSWGSCGKITIPVGPTTVYARIWSWVLSAVHSIGAGYGGSCGTITIGGEQVGAITESPYIYAPTDVTYSVAFLANGGNGTMQNQLFHWNTPQALLRNAFTRTGYAHAGWNTKADGSGKAFVGGGNVKNLGDATLYAQWLLLTNTITYMNAVDGTDCVRNPNPTSYTVEDDDITFVAPVRPGFTFDGWTWDGQDTPVFSVTIPHGALVDRTFTAHWSFCPIVTLTPDTGDVVLYDGHTVTGTGGISTHVTVLAGATVALSNATITGTSPYSIHNWAGITCLGDAVIILEDDNIVNSRHMYYPGIQPGPPGTTLTIRGNGSLEACGEWDGPGIGSGYGGTCGNIVIEGGVIAAKGGTDAPGIGSGDGGTCGDIVIEGGVIVAMGGTNASGIGSGRTAACGDITISGGTITATGGRWSAGIGCGNYGICGDMTISGGTITATGGEQAPGIGCGLGNRNTPSSCGDITIGDGVTFVTATAGASTTNCVGTSFRWSSCGAVTIAGVAMGSIEQSTVTYDPSDTSSTHDVTFDANGGEGEMADRPFAANVPQCMIGCSFARAHYDFVEWNTRRDGTGIGFAAGQAFFCYGDITLYAQWTPHPYVIDYVLGEGGVKGEDALVSYTVESGDITLEEPVRNGFVFVGWTWEGQDTPTMTVTIPHGSAGDRTFIAHWVPFSPLVVLTAETGDVTLYNEQTLTGTGGADTHVVIAKGATVTISNVNITAISDDYSHNWAGITCLGNAIIILEGDNVVKGGDGSPGIQPGPAGKTLVIRGGGSLDASSLGWSAGIGTGDGGACGDIVIEGGIITAMGNYGAGIGSGYGGTCGDVVIEDGVITARGCDASAGIGSGNGGSCASITICGGIVDAWGDDAAGIGCGSGNRKISATCGDITISGGFVTAFAGGNGACIGSGVSYSSCGDIAICGGTVTVTNANCGAGIGSGWNSSCGDIAILGGTVTATSGDSAAGIGSGYYSSTCGVVTISGGTVVATGGEYAAGIGSGKSAACGDIAISGGTVVATGGEYAAGIGSGYHSVCGDVTISGGTITATGGEDAAGIGSGYYSSCGDVSITDGITRVIATHGSRCDNAIGVSLGGTCGPVAVSHLLNDVTEGATRTITVRQVDYAAWAAAKGIAGTWNATDANGMHNVFRYVFGNATGAFTEQPLLSISFEDGQVVIHTPPLAPVATGFDIAIVATDSLDGKGTSTEYSLNPSGRTEIPVSSAPVRFFRLRVTER